MLHGDIYRMAAEAPVSQEAINLLPQFLCHPRLCNILAKLLDHNDNAIIFRLHLLDGCLRKLLIDTLLSESQGDSRVADPWFDLPGFHLRIPFI